MPAGLKVSRIDTREFKETKRLYMQYTKRNQSQVLNTKNFFIARRATVETPKADANAIMAEFGAANNIRFSKKKGTFVKSKGYSFGRTIGDIPRLAVIINARRAKSGKPGLEGADMKEAMNTVFNARLRSIAYLKSGWLPAIAKLEPYADRGGRPPYDRKGKQYGRPKGGASIARPFWITSAAIWNQAYSKREHRGGFERYGLPALQRAFDFEVKSMREYIERKMREDARRLAIKTN